MSLIRLQLIQATRRLTAHHRWPVLLLMGLLAFYVAVLVTSAGYYLPELVQASLPGRPPLSLVNAYMLGGSLLLLSVRFFLQRPPQVQTRPFAHLPLSRRRLVTFFQGWSVLTLHNLLPLLFVLPFWGRYVAEGRVGAVGPWLWLGGVVLLLLICTFGVTLLRLWMGGSTVQNLLAAIALVGVLVLDQTAGAHLLQQASTWMFSGLVSGLWVVLVPLALLAVALFVYGAVLMERRFRHPREADADGGAAALRIAFHPGAGPVLNLLIAELKLIERNRRPRSYFVLSLFFGTVYVGFMLVSGVATESVLMATFVGVFASGIFALNYGQLMFGWESSYYDGLLARNVSPVALVRAKLTLLQASCLVFWALSAPVVYGLAPGLAVPTAAFLVYNLGITCPLMLVLALQNRRRIDLARGGHLFNYEGFGLAHWLWFLPTFIPPCLLLLAFGGPTPTALASLGVIGAGGVLLSSPLSRFFAAALWRQRHQTATGFRSSSPPPRSAR